DADVLARLARGDGCAPGAALAAPQFEDPGVRLRRQERDNVVTRIPEISGRLIRIDGAERRGRSKVISLSAGRRRHRSPKSRNTQASQRAIEPSRLSCGIQPRPKPP